MLSDTAIRNLKPREKPYKVSDRDGLYLVVSPRGTVTFRYDYRLNGRRETLTIGRYGADGISLARARARLDEAKRAVLDGRSPSQEKQRAKQRATEAETLATITARWLAESPMADTTRSMRQSIINRDILPAFGGRRLHEISVEDLRALCNKVKDRGAPATAVHVREIVKLIFTFANNHGESLANPADDIRPISLGSFRPKDRALSPTEIRVMHSVLENVPTFPTIKLALRLILLTLVRKSELTEAKWSEVDFAAGVWTIPKERMKARKAHVVYLSQQALDILVALRTCACGSRFVLPSRYDADRCMSRATLNRVTQLCVERAQALGLPLDPFTVHDLRRTGSTILNEVGFNGDWIEKALAHTDGRSSRGVYNKAEYAEQRRHMLQEWADMIDAWIAGESHTPILQPSSVVVPTISAPL